jgi:hypothetical protein
MRDDTVAANHFGIVQLCGLVALRGGSSCASSLSRPFGVTIGYVEFFNVRPASRGARRMLI